MNSTKHRIVTSPSAAALTRHGAPETASQHSPSIRQHMERRQLISNRHLVRLQTDVTSTKQTKEVRSNRHSMTHIASADHPKPGPNHPQTALATLASPPRQPISNRNFQKLEIIATHRKH
jgi:hypothetical protein